MNGPEKFECGSGRGGASLKETVALSARPIDRRLAKTARPVDSLLRGNGAAPDIRGQKRPDRSRAPQRWIGISIDRIGGLLNVTPDELQRGRRLFALLGDPGRRTILERLARRPQRPGSALPEITGMNGADIYHRLRSLRWGHVLMKDRHSIYHVDQASLECARKYVDTLIVVAARSQGFSQ